MLDHISLHVSDYPKAKEFYRTSLLAIGYSIVVDLEVSCSFGINGRPTLWLKSDGARGAMHIAFATDTTKNVDAFYDAALKAGAKDNGAPGLRERPWGNRYAAFVIDPEGNNIEVVCHATK